MSRFAFPFPVFPISLAHSRRRREAAELARALQLSTQEAKTVSNLSPHTISSSKSNSQDSREMELKTVAPVYKRLTSSADLPPVVGTYAQDMAGVNTSTPRHLPMLSSMVDPIVTAVTPSNSISRSSSRDQCGGADANRRSKQ